MTQKIKVPFGMVKAMNESPVWEELRNDFPEMRHLRISVETQSRLLEAALRWLSENPIVPTDEQMSECGACDEMNFRDASEIVVRFQRYFMFLEPEEELPAEVKELTFINEIVIADDEMYRKVKAKLEKVANAAYRIGLRNKKDQ